MLHKLKVLIPFVGCRSVKTYCFTLKEKTNRALTIDEVDEHLAHARNIQKSLQNLLHDQAVLKDLSGLFF